MKIYHLNIKDESDSRFDMNFFYTHDDESKTITDLEKDYVRAYEYITDSIGYDNTLEYILIKVDSYGWKNINVETAKVRY
jgi:hypothetical protein